MTKNEEFVLHCLKQLGNKIAEVRQGKNISQMALGAKCRMETATINQIETGAIDTKLRTLLRIAAALDVNIREFF